MPTSQCHHARGFYLTYTISLIHEAELKKLNKGMYLKFQADVETDEVYAQMTLQPLTPVIL